MVGKYNPEKHHRRTIRLKGYNYSWQGAYFVTICIQNRECILGSIQDEKMILNEAGLMIKETWEDLSVKYSGIEIDQYEIMPNHIHGIILLSSTHTCNGNDNRACCNNDIVGAGPRACPACESNAGIGLSGKQYGKSKPCKEGKPYKQGNHGGIAPTLSLPDVVHRFKSFSTAIYRNCVEKLNWTPFPGKLWQRNYYDHIIRNDDELNRIREYISNNPLQWDYDENNPINFNDVK